MKKTFRKILSAVLIAVMLVGVAPVGGNIKASALASSGQCGENVYYTFDESTGLLTISGEGEMIRSFLNYDEIKNVVIENGITWIDREAFYGCTGLTSITIPDTVVYIGNDAFFNCLELTSITIPDSVIYIGEEAFSNCTSLTSIVIPEGITSIGDRTFSGCTGLTRVTIPDSVTSIGEMAFYGCTCLTSITISNNLTSIGYSAFEGCTGLTSITIPDSVTNIDNSAFYGCTGLTSIIMPDSVTYLSSDAFDDTGYYNDSDNWENGILYVNNCLVCAEPSITGAHEIKKGIKVIAMGAFRGCAGLTSIMIPDSLTSISSGLFENCTGLISIVIPDGVKNIGINAFRGCTGLTNITIPNSVTEMGYSVFAGCSSLTSIAIPNSITSIPLSAFDNCSSLTSIKIPDSVANIGTYAFFGCTGLTSITVPDSVTSIGYAAFGNCAGLTSITVDINNKIYYSSNNCNSIIETESNTLIAGCKNTVIPDSVTSIGEYAFYSCTGLTSITIPDSVTSIGDYAFENCTGLTTIIISDSVTSIGRAFEICASLTDVYYTGSESEWKEISIDDGNERLTNATIHYNYSGSHTHTLKHITVPSTCKVAGIEYDICDDCGETFNETTLPLAAHTWGEWKTVKKPTATAEGLEKRSCSVCGREETRSIEKSNALVDENTGIEIVYDDEYDSGTEIKVEEQFSGKSFQLINSAYGEVNSKIYDIATYKDGVKVQPNGEITVRVPLPAEFKTDKVFVCYVDSVSGKVTKIPCEVKDGYVIFKTNHFSEYAVVEQAPSVKSVSIGDVSLNYKKSTTIKPTIKADDGAKYTVKYSSSNPKVATVDNNGKVTATKRGSGSATITCTVTDSNGNTVTDTCKVNVKLSFGQILITYILFGWIWY